MQYLEVVYLLGILLLNVSLPGLFILSIFSDFKEKWKLMPLIPVTSMAVNAFLYWLFYFVGIYYKTTVLLLCAGYIAVFVKLCKHGFGKMLWLDFKEFFKKLNEYFKNLTAIEYFAWFFILIFFIQLLLKSITTPFTIWDAVVSWNYWAAKMGENAFVGNEVFYGIYPQLLPSLFSGIYKMNVFNSDMFLNIAEYVSHFYETLFAVLTCCILAGYARLKKINPLVVIVLLLINRIYGAWIGSGYSDLLPGLFVIAFFYLLDLFYENQDYLKNKNEKYLVFVFMASLYAAATGFGKQQGALLVAFFAVWLICDLVKKRIFKTALLKILLAALIPVAALSTFYLRQAIKYMPLVKYYLNANAQHYSADKNMQLYESYENKTMDKDLKISYPSKVNLLLHTYCFKHSPQDFRFRGKIFSFPSRSKYNPITFIFRDILIMTMLYMIVRKKEVFKTLFVLVMGFTWAAFFSISMRHILLLNPLISLLMGLFLARAIEVIRTKKIWFGIFILILFNEVWIVIRTRDLNYIHFLLPFVIIACAIFIKYLLANERMIKILKQAGFICLLILFVGNNYKSSRFIRNIRKINWRVFNMSRDEKFNESFPQGGQLLELIRKHRDFEQGNRIIASNIELYNHPDVYYLAEHNIVPQARDRLKLGDYLITVNGGVGKLFPELDYVGGVHVWCVFKKIVEKGGIARSKNSLRRK